MTEAPREKPPPVPPQTPEAASTSSVTDAARSLGQGGGQAFDFFSSAVAGLLLGLGIDWLAGTSPLATVIGIVLGFVAGFAKLWAASATLVEQAEERRRG